MKTLIVEDNLSSSKLLLTFLSSLGECDIVDNGQKALDMFKDAWKQGAPYSLICMDIMMPHMDGQEALNLIRRAEKEIGVREEAEVRVLMTTALDDPKHVIDSLKKGGATSYIVKPIRKDKLFDEIRKMGLIE